MREITTHKTNQTNQQLAIEVLDAPGHGNACHLYAISGMNAENNPSFKQITDRRCTQILIPFQNGTIPDVGVNGVTIEALLAICIDRLRGFQSGKFKNDFNGAALEACEVALGMLHERTLEREKRRVEGTHQV